MTFGTDPMRLNHAVYARRRVGELGSGLEARMWSDQALAMLAHELGGLLERADAMSLVGAGGGNGGGGGGGKADAGVQAQHGGGGRGG